MTRTNPVEVMPDPWERQPGEPEKAFSAFCRYRDLPLGERSLRVAAGPDASAQKVRRYKTWSSEFRWVERAAAYADHLDRIARNERERAIRDMERRHARAAQTIQGIAGTKLRRISETPAALDQTMTEMTPFQAVKFMEVAARIERQALGHVADIPKKPDYGPLMAELGAAKARAREAGNIDGLLKILAFEKSIIDGGVAPSSAAVAAETYEGDPAFEAMVKAYMDAAETGNASTQ